MEFSDLFDLSDNDYAVDLLTRVFGGVVEFVSGEGGSLTDGTLLTDLISIFNTACLLLALIVGSYTTYVLVFDTAADGKTFGNQSDTKYTVVRILVGAISFVPIQGGLTVAQLALIWLSVQGSALGDVAWRTVADGALRDEPVLAASAPLSETDYLINQQFANTLYALVHGELCQRQMDRLAVLAQRPAGTTQRVVDSDSYGVTRTGFLGINSTEYTHLERQIYYSDEGGSYGRADNLCASVSHQVEYIAAADGESSADFATRVGSGVLLNRYQAADGAITGNLLPVASQIADLIFAGERDRDAIQTLMDDAVSNAFANYMAGITSGGLSNTEYEALHADLLDEVDTLGWPFALSWHRGITMAAYTSTGTAAELQIYTNFENGINDYFGGLLSRMTGSVDAAMFQKVNDDFVYLEQFEGFVTELGTYEPGATATVVNAGNSDTSGWFYRLYQVLLEVFTVTDGGDTATYLDPMADVITVGKQISAVGGTMIAAGAVADGVSMFGELAKGLGYVAEYLLYPVGWALLIFGFVLIAIIPAIPLVYFFAAVLSWLLTVIEILFAAPLAVLAYFAPARDGTLIGPAAGILTSILGAALRPLFIILGFIASLIIMRIGMDFLFLLFSGFLGFMTAGGSWFTVIILVGLVCMYVLVTLYLVIVASSLITELGDRVLSLAGMLTERANTMNLESNVVGTAAPTRIISNQAAAVGRVTKAGGGQGAQRLLKGPKSKGNRQ